MAAGDQTFGLALSGQREFTVACRPLTEGVIQAIQPMKVVCFLFLPFQQPWG